MSSAANFYGPGGPYAIFSGHDASLALAKTKVDPSLLNQKVDGSDISQEEMQTLQEWFEKYEGKYPKVGTVSSNN